VGQYVELTLGTNAGRRLRVVGYREPAPPNDAGGFLLGRDALLHLSASAGEWNAGDSVTVGGGGTGVVLAFRHPYLLVERRDLLPTTTGAVTNDTTGAAATADAVEIAEGLTAEVGTAAWRVVDIAEMFGLALSNAESPTGGRDAVLDSLVYERGTQRAPEEDDEALRERAANPSDAVTPGAVLRAANRALAPFGVEADLREVGTAKLPGFYSDVDACDLDAVAVAGGALGFASGETVVQASTLASGVAVTQSPAGLGPLAPAELVGVARVRGTFVSGQPIAGRTSGASVAIPVFTGGLRAADRDRTAFAYVDMRAYFVLATPHRGQGDFGCAFDSHPFGFCDSAPALSFADGFAASSAAIAQRLWQAVDEVRPAGSGFTLDEDVSL